MTMRKTVLALALALGLTLTACGGNSGEASAPSAPASSGTPAVSDAGSGAAIPGVEDGVLTVGMECAYAPYNWTQMDDSNGAVPIVNNPGSYANGYDVMMAKKICEANGWELEVMALEWGGLSPALDAGTIDVAIAGQSMTAERMAEVDMAGPYYYATVPGERHRGLHLHRPAHRQRGGGQEPGSGGTQLLWHRRGLPVRL